MSIRHDNKTVLFFDDWELSSRENLIRRVGEPKLVSESIFEDPYMNISWGYPTIFQVPNTGQWRCLYQGYSNDHKYRLPLVAESDDGIHWQIPDLSKRIPLADRMHPHQLLSFQNFGEWSCCYVDENAKDPAERIKGFIVYHTDKYHLRTRLVVSSDGFCWRDVRGVKWSSDKLAPDPATAAFWNERRNAYIMTLRPMWTDRRIALVETKDWRDFSNPELVIQPDALDPPLTECYGMPVFPYEGTFIGFLWLFHPTPKADKRFNFYHKYLHGKIDCQLVYSRNGWHFQRTLRELLFSNDNLNQFGGGCIYPSSMLVDTDNCVRIYSSASKAEHGILKEGSGAILLHKLRLDGFTYLETGGGLGLLGTRPLFWRGGEIKLNVEAPWGEVRVQITDPKGFVLKGYSFQDCIPFSGDELFYEPHWRNGTQATSLKKRLIRMEIQMHNARIYAIRGNFVPLVAAEAWRFEHFNEQPEFR